MQDIMRFLNTRSDANEGGRGDDDDDRGHVCVQYWTAASEENFLYSRLMSDILCGAGVTCSDEIHDQLQRFPPGLTGCFLRCVDRISRLTRPERGLAR